MLTKVERKIRPQAVKWMDSITVSMNDLLEDLKEQVGDICHEQNLSGHY